MHEVLEEKNNALFTRKAVPMFVGFVRKAKIRTCALDAFLGASSSLSPPIAEDQKMITHAPDFSCQT